MRYDRQILTYFEDRFAGHGYRVPDLLREIALSRAFSQVRPDPEQGETIVNAGDVNSSKTILND